MKIFLAGHKGLVGSAIFRKLIQNKYNKIITTDRKKLDLLDQKKVFDFLNHYLLLKNLYLYFHLPFKKIIL